jgi:xanthosine utilization system XapX-like protein
MAQLRVMLVAGVIVGTLCALFSIYIYQSDLIVVAGSLWTAIGYRRVFGQRIGAPTFELALKGVLMSLAWPLVPKRS